MDGTIVDSVPAWHKTFNRVLDEVGGKKITLEEFCYDVLGQSTEKDIERFFPTLSDNELHDYYNKFFLEYIQEVRLFADSIKVLEYLESKKIVKGIVTNTPRDLMIKTLDLVDIRDWFEVILGGTDVTVGKPNPEMLHKACKMLDIDESEALMVGDTQADMGAGRSAGCFTLGIGVDGDWRIESLSEMTGFLEKAEEE